MRLLGSAVVVALLVGGVAAGATAYGWAVAAVTLLVLLDLGCLLARVGARPVLPATALAGVAVPLALTADPRGGLDRLSGLLALAFIVAVTGVLVFGRRRGVVVGLAATVMVCLLAGLGAGGLVLLRALEGGLHWTVVVLVLGVAADAGGWVATTRAWPAARQRTAAAWRGGGALAGAALAAAGLLWLLRPTPDAAIVALLAVVAVAAAVCGWGLHRLFLAGAGPAQPRRWICGGGVTGLVDSLLLGATPAYVLVRALTG